jgi:hypothetical protein
MTILSQPLTWKLVTSWPAKKVKKVNAAKANAALIKARKAPVARKALKVPVARKALKVPVARKVLKVPVARKALKVPVVRKALKVLVAVAPEI